MSVAVPLAVGLVLSPLVLSLLREREVLDHPCARSSHARPTPRGGGFAPMLAALLGALATGLTGRAGVALVIGSALYGILGMAEDLIGVPVLRRLAAQFLIGVSVAPLLLGDLPGPRAWHLVVAAGVVLWLVGFVNSFNFMDGVNGIAAAQVFAAALTWWLVAEASDTTGLAVAAGVLAAAMVGFVPLNFPTARMFLGDVGSYFVGAWLAIIVVVGVRSGIAVEAMVAPLALSLADTGLTLARRVRRRARWEEPHREHVYQRLLVLGWSHADVTGVVFLATVLCGALGAVSEVGPLGWRLTADLAIVLVLCGYVRLPDRLQDGRRVVVGWSS